MLKKVIEKKELPYLFKLNNKNQSLYYFGTEHSTDPKHHQFEVLRDFLGDFLKNTSENRIVFIEGNQIPIKALLDNEGDNIRKLGERGFILDLALKNNIRYVYAELSFQEEADLLNKEFSKENIVYFYIVRLMCGLLRKNQKLNFDLTLEKSLNDWVQFLNWDKKLFTKNGINKTHQKLFGQEFSVQSVELIKKVCIPINQDFSIINKIAKMSSEIRDNAVLKKIKEDWKKGKSIFIIYGYNHSTQQEPFLRDMCK